MPEFHAEPKVQRETPDDLQGGRTVSWSDNAHFLLVTIDGDTMAVRAIGELVDGKPQDLPRWTSAGDQVTGAIIVRV